MLSKLVISVSPASREVEEGVFVFAATLPDPWEIFAGSSEERKTQANRTGMSHSHFDSFKCLSHKCCMKQ